MARRFDSKGVIAIIAAIALPVLLVLASGAIDLGRSYVVKQRLQTGVDAAALVAQVNAANATPETACQSTDAMNAVLNSNITSNGFLSTSTPTLVSCSYDSATKKIMVTGTVNLKKTIGFAPSSISATGYASIDDDQDTSPWMYQFKTQNNNCQYNPYLDTLSLVSSDKALIMSGPVQNNCASSDWTNTTSIVSNGGGTSINTFNVTGTVTMNGTQGARLCQNSYYLCVSNNTNMQGTIIDNIPIYTSGKLYLAGGTVLSSALTPAEVIHVVGGGITNDTSLPVTISNLNIASTNNTAFDVNNGTLNITNGTTINTGNSASTPVLSNSGTGTATVNISGQSSASGQFQVHGPLNLTLSDGSSFQGSLMLPSTSTINLTNKSTVMLYNQGTTAISDMTLSIDNSTWTYDNVSAGWTISNSTISLSNGAKMTSAPQNNVTATLSGGSTMNFVTSSVITGSTYTLSGGSTLDISSLPNWNSNLTVHLSDTSKIIVKQTTYSGPGATGSSFDYTCTSPSDSSGPPICTKH